MLKRSDLAKQLDLVVKQEIKNYNDSLSFVLQSIRDLKSNIEEVSSVSEKNHSFLKDQVSHLYTCSSHKDDEYKSRFQKVHSLVNDQEGYVAEFKSKCEDMFQLIFERLENLTKSSEDFFAYSTKIEALEEKVDRYSRIHDDNIVELNMRLKKDMIRMKEEILSIPSPFVSEKKDIEDKLNSHVIDVEGVLREIRLTKKDMHIMEKKMENLYTLLGRKQNGGNK